MRLLLKVIRWDVPSRHSAGVLPLKRGPDAERFSSVAQVNVQWSTITSYAPATVESASVSQPLIFGLPASPVRTRMCWMMTSCVATSKPPRMKVMPGEGAVCPAMVRKGSRRRDGAQVEIYDATDFEDHDARTFALYGFEKRAGAFRRESGDANDAAAAPAGRVRGPALRARESGQGIGGGV